jgi:hypothetical protein
MMRRDAAWGTTETRSTRMTLALDSVTSREIAVRARDATRHGTVRTETAINAVQAETQAGLDTRGLSR